MPIMTVIIPTSEAGPALKRCLTSLARQTFDDFDIVIVANGTKVGKRDLEIDGRIGSKMRLITCEENRGYGGACNLGALATVASFLLFLNDDTSLQDNCLAELYKSLCSKKDTMFQPIIYHEYAQQTRAGNPCDIFGAAGLGFYGNCGTGTFYASGASLAVSKAIYNSIGGFDEDLFLYYDDVDFSWRARLLGYNVSVTRTAFCHHSGGKSSATMPHMIKFYLTQRNRLRVLIKNYSIRRIISRIPIAIFLIVAGSFFLAIRTRLSGYVVYGLKPLVSNLIVLRNTLTERNWIQRERVRNDFEIEKVMCRSSMDICVLKRTLSRQLKGI